MPPQGDLHPDQVTLIANQLGVTEQDVINMNRRLAGDASLNTPIRQDSDAVEWQDWLLDDSPSQERVLVESEDFDNRRTALREALKTLSSRERHIFEARRLADEPSSLNELAHEFGVSRERVRQIEVRAFEKVQNAVRHRVSAMERPKVLAAHQGRISVSLALGAEGTLLSNSPLERGKQNIIAFNNVVT